MRFFFYGTLLDRDVTALVLGRRLPPAAFVPAMPAGPCAAAGEGRAAIRSSCAIRAARCRARSSAGLSARDVARLAAYEGPGYRIAPLRVQSRRMR